MKKEMICIICPSSCRLTVEDTPGGVTVTGNTCKRGADHGIQEFTAPLRMLTTTVAISGAAVQRLPVASAGEIPKEKLPTCLAELYKLTVQAPITCGDIVAQNICGTGVDILATRTLQAAR